MKMHLLAPPLLARARETSLTMGYLQMEGQILVYITYMYNFISLFFIKESVSLLIKAWILDSGGGGTLK